MGQSQQRPKGKERSPTCPAFALSCACLSCWRALLWSFAVELCFGACFSCNSPETPSVCVLRVGCVRKMCVDKDTVGQIVTGENNHLSSSFPSTLTYLFFFSLPLYFHLHRRHVHGNSGCMHAYSSTKKTRHIFCSEWLAPLLFFLVGPASLRGVRPPQCQCRLLYPILVRARVKWLVHLFVLVSELTS